MVRKFAYYEEKDGRLRKLPKFSSDSVLQQPDPGEKPWRLLCGSEEELVSLMTVEEAKRKELFF
jgi:hypothetical protein